MLAAIVTATGLSLVVVGVISVVAWRKGQVDHRLPSGLLAAGASVLLLPALASVTIDAPEDVAERQVAVPDVHDEVASVGVQALRTAGLNPQTLGVCSHDVAEGRIVQVRHGDTRPYNRAQRILIDARGVTAHAHRLWAGTPVVVEVATPCEDVEAAGERTG